jgi:hypothetical protein
MPADNVTTTNYDAERYALLVQMLDLVGHAVHDRWRNPEPLIARQCFPGQLEHDALVF